MNPAFKIWRLALTLLFALGLLLSFSQLSYSAEDDNELYDTFIRLKESFEKKALKNSEPQVLAALSAETSALAWSLTAAELSDDADAREEWLNRASAFEESWHGRDWSARYLKALNFYYEASEEVALYLITQSKRTDLASDFETIRISHRLRLAALKDKSDVDLEHEVIATGSLCGLMGVSIRSLGGASMDKPVGEVISGLNASIDDLELRADLHYRARLALWAAANLERLSTLVFMMGQTAGPPLSRNLALLQRTLNQEAPGQTIPEAAGLAWVAQAQATLPLAYWLATR